MLFRISSPWSVLLTFVRHAFMRPASREWVNGRPGSVRLSRWRRYHLGMFESSSHVVVVGGGFSGVLAAVHLLRRGFGTSGRVTIINRSGAMARGVAYGTNSNQHVLNVPAGRMSAFDDDPDGFVRFLQDRGVAADGGSFVSRHHYGAYLEWLLSEAAAGASAGALRQINAEVVRIVPAGDDSHAVVWLEDGSHIRADRVVLAIGNYPPEDPVVDDRGFVNNPRYIRDPWCRDVLTRIDRTRPILLIGTGLTMVDIALQLEALGTSGHITAVSRRGLLPQPHRGAGPAADHSVSVTELLEGPATARAWVRAIRRQTREAASRGVDWRDVVAALRPLTPRLWQALPIAERARFLRHVRPYWEVHRHRMAPELAEAFARLTSSGQVTIRAGRLVAIRADSDRLHVEMRLRGAGAGTAQTQVLDVGTIINCSGPAGDTRRLRDRLFESLRADGVLVPDALGLGIEVSADGAIVDRDGKASRVLSYVGPFLRARDWEATAVPELRRHVSLTIDHLLAHMSHMSQMPRMSHMPHMPTQLPVPVEVSWTLLKHLTIIAQRAGEAILACDRPGCETKSDGSPVTAADTLAQDLICAELTRLDASVPIVAEESGLPDPDARRDWRRYWLVDPLDGTKEFIAGRPDYTVNIALIEDGVPVMGVVSAPAMRVMYAAARGLGAWRQAGDESPTRLIAHGCPPDAGIRILESRSHPSAELEAFLRPLHVIERIQLGSSLKFCWLAEGRADCYPRFGPTMAWDVAAGDCVFRNAIADGDDPHPSPLTYRTTDFRQAPFVMSLAPALLTESRGV